LKHRLSSAIGSADCAGKAKSGGREFTEAVTGLDLCCYPVMLNRAFSGSLVLGGAVVTAVALYWLLFDAFGLDDRTVFQGVTISAGLIGVAYLADVLPGRR